MESPGLGWLIAIGLLALAVRLAALGELASLPLYTTPQLDGLEFLSWARWIAAGDSHWPQDPSHAPLYPYLLAGILRAGGGIGAARLAQCAGGAWLCCLVAVLGARHAGPAAGRAAGLLLALQGPLVWIETSILAEPLLLLLVAGALVAWTGRAADRWSAPLAGLLLGLAASARPTALAVLPALAFGRAALAGRRGWRAVAGAVLASLAVFSVPVALASRATGGFVPGQAFGGYAFYLGNRAGASGLPDDRPGGSWDLRRREMERRGVIGVAARDRAYARAAIDDILSSPGEAVRRFAAKALWTLQAEEVRDTHGYRFFRSQSHVLGLLPGTGLLIPLAAAGLLARPSGRLVRLLVSGGGLLALTCVAVMVGTRYRLPVVPFLAALAGHGAVWMAGLVRARRRTVWSVLSGVALVAAGTHVWRHPPSRNPAEELHLSGSSLELEGRFDEAETAYRRALQQDARSSLAWTGLGRLALRRGDLAAARRDLAAAVESDPADHRARYHLGLAHRAAGEFALALPAFERAIDLAPDYWRAALGAGDALLALGRFDDAARRYREVAAREPREVAAHLGVARAAGAAGDPRTGVVAARRAVELDGANGEAWLLVAALSLETGDLEAVSPALARAEAALGPAAALRVALIRSQLERIRSAARSTRGAPF